MIRTKWRKSIRFEVDLHITLFAKKHEDRRILSYPVGSPTRCINPDMDCGPATANIAGLTIRDSDEKRLTSSES